MFFLLIKSPIYMKGCLIMVYIKEHQFDSEDNINYSYDRGKYESTKVHKFCLSKRFFLASKITNIYERLYNYGLYTITPSRQ